MAQWETLTTVSGANRPTVSYGAMREGRQRTQGVKPYNCQDKAIAGNQSRKLSGWTNSSEWEELTSDITNLEMISGAKVQLSQLQEKNRPPILVTMNKEKKKVINK